MKTVYNFLIFILVLSCSGRKTNINTIKLEYNYQKDEALVNPRIQGVWKSIGNGYYLEARKDSLLLYSYTQNFCYKEKNDYLEGLLHSQSQFILHDDTLGIYLTDFGDHTRELQTKKDFVRVDQLPENTIGFSEMTKLGSQELFKLYTETLGENYAFNSRRNLNWKVLYSQYKDSVLDNETLFNTMGQIAMRTKDQHTKVISEDGRTLQYRITPSAEVVTGTFNTQSEIGNLNQYFNQFFETNYKNISDSLLHGKGRKAANGKLEWGSLNESVGYIHIHSFAGFLGSEYSRRQQIDSLNAIMVNVIGEFENKDAIIIDVSFNFGGYDATALTIASYFTDQPVLSHVSQVYNNGEFYDEDSVIVYPADSITFTKPVYLLMTDISRSAAEGFAMMMGALPHVKLVGSNTLGTLSGMLGKSVGNFYTTYSNQRLVDAEGRFYEVSGVKPDLPLEVFPQENVFNGHREAVLEIVRWIEQD